MLKIFGIPIPGIPDRLYGIIGLILGFLGSIMATTQFVWNWFGIDDGDKALYSVMVILILCFACGFATVNNMMHNTKWFVFSGRTPFTSVAKTAFFIFIVIMVFIMAANGVAMTMDVNYATYCQSRQGFFTGIRQLTAVTAQDVSDLALWGEGLQQIIKAIFLTVPCLIATWGGLGVLTADSISDAEGGILAIVAAFVVFIIVWIFKAIGIALMTLTLSLVININLFDFVVKAFKLLLVSM